MVKNLPVILQKSNAMIFMNIIDISYKFSREKKLLKLCR
jgi:hypothetical protein